MKIDDKVFFGIIFKKEPSFLFYPLVYLLYSSRHLYFNDYWSTKFFKSYSLKTLFILVKSRKSFSITNFFISTFTDTPFLVKKTNSLFRPIANTPLLRFFNFLMLHGTRGYIWRNWSWALKKLSQNWQFLSQIVNSNLPWYFFYSLNHIFLILKKQPRYNLKLWVTPTLPLKGNLIKNNWYYDTIFPLNLYFLKKNSTSFTPFYVFYKKKR